jgi:hypothetical protein
MGEIGHPEDAEHHGKADGDQRIEASKAHSVDDLLGDVEAHIHLRPPLLIDSLRDRLRPPPHSSS